MGFLQDYDTTGIRLMILIGTKRKPLKWHNWEQNSQVSISSEWVDPQIAYSPLSPHSSKKKK